MVYPIEAEFNTSPTHLQLIIVFIKKCYVKQVERWLKEHGFQADFIRKTSLSGTPAAAINYCRKEHTRIVQGEAYKDARKSDDEVEAVIQAANEKGVDMTASHKLNGWSIEIGHCSSNVSQYQLREFINRKRKREEDQNDQDEALEGKTLCIDYIDRVKTGMRPGQERRFYSDEDYETLLKRNLKKWRQAALDEKKFEE